MCVCIPRELHYYFDELRDGILVEARRFEHLGTELNLRPTERLGVGEVEKLSQMVADGVQAMIIAPDDSGGWPKSSMKPRRGVRAYRP